MEQRRLIRRKRRIVVVSNIETRSSIVAVQVGLLRDGHAKLLGPRGVEVVVHLGCFLDRVHVALALVDPQHRVGRPVASFVARRDARCLQPRQADAGAHGARKRVHG
eukprot:4160672-Prymnesium_polylepis.1